MDETDAGKNPAQIHRPNIPLPSELPKNIDFSQFPQEVLRSSAVETLIQQNEDLMGRLKVNLRRISKLEGQLSENENFKKKFKFHFENLREQSLLLQEKCSTLETRKDDQLGKMNQLAEQNKALELEYARLYTESKNQRQTLMDNIAKLSTRISSLLKYRSKVSVIARNLQSERLKSEDQLILEQKKLRELSQKFKDIQQQSAESTSYIQSQGLQHKKELETLTQSYEQQFAELEKRIEITEHENVKLKPLLNENIKLQNEKIGIERSYAELKLSSSQNLQTKTTENLEAQQIIQSLEINLEELADIESQLKTSQTQKTALEKQLETTQSLWHESQKDTEKLAEKNTALQKLNQNLSLTLNRYRQEIQDLKNKLQNQSSVAGRSKAPNKVDFQLPDTQWTSSSKEKADKDSKNIPSRLESLIAEIEIGQ